MLCKTIYVHCLREGKPDFTVFDIIACSAKADKGFGYYGNFGFMADPFHSVVEESFLGIPKRHFAVTDAILDTSQKMPILRYPGDLSVDAIVLTIINEANVGKLQQVKGLRTVNKVRGERVSPFFQSISVYTPGTSIVFCTTRCSFTANWNDGKLEVIGSHKTN